MTIFWIWPNDIIPFWLFCIFIYYIYSSWGGRVVKITQKDEPEVEKNIKNNAKNFTKMEKEQLHIENLSIKYEEIRNDIDKLNFESSSDLEVESENNLKVRKLELQLKHLHIKIEEKRNLINSINDEIKWIM